ncbi:MAG: hypothetical protein ACYDH6_19695 [Acidimicrobiales bacterium]
MWTGLAVDRGMSGHQAGDRPLSIQSAAVCAQGWAAQMTASQEPYGPQHPYALGGDMPWYIGPPFALRPSRGPAPQAAPRPKDEDTCLPFARGKVRCRSTP